MLMYNDEIEFDSEGFGWTTRNELQFLEGLWAGTLDRPAGSARIDQLSALKGYAQRVRSRAKWENVNRDTVLRWLIAHGLQEFIGRSTSD